MPQKFEPYPIELPVPDISCWQEGNIGVEYVYTFKSEKPGKHAMVMALVHGNEISGALTVDRLLKDNFRPSSGTLSLAFANVAAFKAFSIQNPDATRFLEEDMNRVWSEESLDGNRNSIELCRARQLRPVIDQVDLLLDLHSMHEADPPIMMGGTLEKGQKLARSIGVPEFIVMDKGHAAGKRLRDYGGFGDPQSDKSAVLLESGQHFEKNAYPLALDATARFLIMAGIATREEVAPYLSTSIQMGDQKLVDITDAVTIKTDDFRFTESYLGMQVIEKKGTIIGYDGDEAVITPYDRCVLIQPTLRHARKGTTAVRLGRFIG